MHKEHNINFILEGGLHSSTYLLRADKVNKMNIQLESSVHSILSTKVKLLHVWFAYTDNEYSLITCFVHEIHKLSKENR